MLIPLLNLHAKTMETTVSETDSIGHFLNAEYVSSFTLQMCVLMFPFFFCNFCLPFRLQQYKREE